MSLLLLNGLNERLLGVVHVDDGDLDLEGAHGLPVIAVVVVTEQLADGEAVVDGGALDEVGQGDQGGADHVIGLLARGLGATGESGDGRVVIEKDNF